MRFAFLLFALAAQPSFAGEFVLDAFGLYRPDQSENGRRDWSGYRSGSSKTSAGDPDRILIFSGPKSLVAGKDEGHVVALVLDRHGNLIGDDTDLGLRIGDLRAEATTQSGIADRIFMPPPVAGEIMTGATSEQRQSSRAMVRVVPDLGSIVPVLDPVQATVAQEEFFELPVRRLTDRFGNVAEDGTAISVWLDHSSEQNSFATAVAVQGRAEPRFLSRDIEGGFEATAHIGANFSDPENVRIQYARASGLPAAAVEHLPSIAALQITVGPFLTTDGYTLSDGAPVLIELTDKFGDVHVATAWARDGSTVAMVPVSHPDEVAELHVTSPLGRMDLTLDWTETTRPEAAE